MKASEMRQMSIAELQKELNALLREQFNMRIQKGTGQLSHSHLVKKTKTDIARIKTIVIEKKIKGTHDE